MEEKFHGFFVGRDSGEDFFAVGGESVALGLIFRDFFFIEVGALAVAEFNAKIAFFGFEAVEFATFNVVVEDFPFGAEGVFEFFEGGGAEIFVAGEEAEFGLDFVVIRFEGGLFLGEDLRGGVFSHLGFNGFGFKNKVHKTVGCFFEIGESGLGF